MAVLFAYVFINPFSSTVSSGCQKHFFYIVSRSFFIIINSVKVDDKKNLQAVYLLQQL